MSFECCKGCKPPKRNVSPNCHMTCPEYLSEKAKHNFNREKEKVRADNAKEIKQSDFDKISYGAMKKYRHKNQ